MVKVGSPDPNQICLLHTKKTPNVTHLDQVTSLIGLDEVIPVALPFLFVVFTCHLFYTSTAPENLLSTSPLSLNLIN